MLLIIFPIIISLCVLGLIFLVFKKIPQIANYSIESSLMPVLNPANAMPLEMIHKKTAVWNIFLSVVKKYYLKMRQNFSRGFKNILALAIKIKSAVLSKKKIIDLRRRLAIRGKGDFNQLKELFNQKRPTFILPQATIDGFKDSSETVIEEVDEPTNSLRTSQEHLDFKKFLNNGKQEKKSYKLEKFSFDQLFKKNKPKMSRSKIVEAGKRSAETFGDKENTELAKFVQKEQVLIQQIANEPHNASLYNKLGGLYLKVKNWQDAKASFSYLLELEPQNKKALKTLDKINKILHNK